VGHFRIFTADSRDTPPSFTARTVSFTVAFASLALVFSFAFYQLKYHWNWSSIYQYRHKFLMGWINTVLISIAALVCSTAIGLCFALAQRSRFLPLRYFGKLYVELVRGTPLLVQILIFFYVVADAFGVSNRYIVGVLTLSIFSGAYITEIIRGGIEGIGKSQLESAKAIGFTASQTYHYVIFPQALRNILPPLAGQFVSLIKDSSLLSIIAINEFTLNAREVNSNTYSTLESYLPLAVGYLLLTLPISMWTRSLERKHRFET
jgi:polar amino acid transport system permease protein